MQVIGKYDKIFKPTLTLYSDLEDISPVEIILPTPPNLKDVPNFKRPTSEQLWETILLPGGNVTKFKRLPKEDQNAFIDNEFKKRYEGYWFMNHGQLTYITGTHYLYLNWWNIDNGLPYYVDTDRESFLHIKRVEENPLCFGLIELTKRRDGKSHRAMCWEYDFCSSHYNCYGGMQSKTDDDAEALFNKLKHGWRKLPFFFRPICSNSTNPKDSLNFEEGGVKSKERLSSEQNINDGKALDSWITQKASVELAYDGQKLHRYVGDEIGKTIKADVYERWKVVKPCLTDRAGNVIGKAILTSTVEEMERKGGNNFKRIWNESDPSAKDKAGKVLKVTPSGLERSFKPAYRGYKIDRYGNSLEKESIEELQAERDSTSDSISLASLKRKYPFTIREAFRVDAKDCYFNPEIIQDRIDEFHLGNPYKVQGNLEWVENRSDTMVEWNPCENGRWFLSHTLESKDANKFIFKSGKKYPTNITKYVMGADPFKSDKTLGARESKGAGAVFMLRDKIKDPDNKDVTKWDTHKFVATYNFRPKDLEEYADDMIKTAVYFGCEVYSENNVETLIQIMRRRGYAGFLAHDIDPVTGKISEKPGHHTSEKTHEEIIRDFEYHIQYHGATECHDEILIQCRDFDGVFTKYDLMIAAGYALKRAKKDMSVYSNKAPMAVNRYHNQYTYNK